MTEKNDDERLNKLIKACKIIAEILPNDAINDSISVNLPEIVPKMVKMLPHLSSSIDMLLRAFIDRFATDNESIAAFYRIFLDEFQAATHMLVKEKTTDYIWRLVSRIEAGMLVSMQDSLEVFLFSGYFKDKERKPHAVKLATYLKEILGE